MRLQFASLRRENKIQIIKHGHQGGGAEENQHRAENPEQQRHGAVEEAIPDRIEQKAPLEEVRDVVRRDGGAVSGAVDEEIDLVDEADWEGVAGEGEEEEEEERDVLERHHKLAVGAVDGVVERLLDAVGAAEHGGEGGAEEDGGCRHQRRPHDRVPEGLNGQDVFLLIILHNGGDPKSTATGISSDDGGEGVGSNLMP